MEETKELSKERQGEIALMILKAKLRHEGVRISKDQMRDLGNMAKKIGVSVAELKQFMQPIVQKMVDECFSEK